LRSVPIPVISTSTVSPAAMLGDLLKVIWHDGQGACLFTKRLERGRFIWPNSADGVVTISSAQLGYLLSGIDWRHPQETWRPTAVG
jgi:transposase